MMKKLIILCVLIIASTSWAGEWRVGVSHIPSAHSEGDRDRCLDDGAALDVGFDWTSWEMDFKYFGLALKTGVLSSYSVIESAHRDTVLSPKKVHRNESAITMLGTLKPILRIWKFRPYLILGAGPDWSTAEGFDFGYLEHGAGVDFQVSDSVSLGISDRKFNRSGSWYRYQSAVLSITF